MKSFFKKNKKGGFSLLELILAVAIFSLSSFFIATILIDSNLNIKFNNERLKALYYVREGVEIVRAIRNTSTSTESSWFTVGDGTYSLSSRNGVWSLVTSTDSLLDNKYRRVVEISSTSSPSFARPVTVTLSWDLTPARPASISLQTILTDWPIITN